MYEKIINERDVILKGAMRPEGSPEVATNYCVETSGDPSASLVPRSAQDDVEERGVVQRWNFPKVLLCITLLSMIFAVNAHADAQKPKSGLPPGTTAPPLALPDLNGKVVQLKDYRGQVVVLNFFAFWCDTWKDEWPHLLKLAKLRETEKFAIVCASVDGSRQQLFRQLTGSNAPFPVLMDSRGYASRAFNITHVPTVMVLDKNGVVRYVHSGYPGDTAVMEAVRKAR